MVIFTNGKILINVSTVFAYPRIASRFCWSPVVHVEMCKCFEAREHRRKNHIHIIYISFFPISSCLHIQFVNVFASISCLFISVFICFVVVRFSFHRLAVVKNLQNNKPSSWPCKYLWNIETEIRKMYFNA